MDKTIQKEINRVIEALTVKGVHTATSYISRKLTVRGIRKMYKGKPKNDTLEFQLTIGKPNYLDRAFIKEQPSFPVKQIYVKMVKSK